MFWAKNQNSKLVGGSDLPPKPNFHLCPFKFISEVAPWSFNKYRSFYLAVDREKHCPQKSLWFIREQFNKNVVFDRYKEFYSKTETEQTFSSPMWEF